MSEQEKMRRVVPPFGWPLRFRAVTVTPAHRQRRLVVPNRYPRQVIGLSFRLPDVGQGYGCHRSLSIMWAKPARWWTR